MTYGFTPPAAPLPPPPPPPHPGPVAAPVAAQPVMPPPIGAPPGIAMPPAATPFRPDAWAPTAPGPRAPQAPASAGLLEGLAARGQALLVGIADKLFPLKRPQAAGIQAAPYTATEKLAQVGRSAIFFALPVGGAALVACGLGWLVGPWVPFVGGHVFGAVAATLAVGHTAGTLLHGAMRLPLVTRPEDRELNSAGATVASAGLGAAFAWGIAAAAGATVTPWILLGGAALGAVPRVLEWMGGKAVQ